MDDRSFDRLARLLGGASDRRTGLKALAGGLLGAGGMAALDADADAKRWGRGEDRRRADDAEAGKKKKGCRPACTDGHVCEKVGKRRECVCPTGITCGGSCCALGQACVDGACASQPEPGRCIAAGQPCKATGRACCDGRACASGQGGLADVACYVPETGPCVATDDCVYGTVCRDGRCTAPPPPPPAGLGETCSVQSGCTAGSCQPYTGPGAPAGTHCTLPLQAVCTGDPECSCYSCSYAAEAVPDVTASSRQGRATVATTCCGTAGGACGSDRDCCEGTTCTGGACVADPCTVCTGGGCAYSTIAAAITAGVADIRIAGGNYEEFDLPAPITDVASLTNLTLRACSAAPVIIDAKQRGRIMKQMPAGSTVTFRNLTLANGASAGGTSTGDGGALNSKGTLHLEGVTVSGSTAGYGGGILIDREGVLTMTDSTVRDCHAITQGDGRGGGVGLYNSTSLTMTRSTITGCTAKWGGGGLSVEAWGSFGTTATLEDSTITDCDVTVGIKGTGQNTEVGGGGGAFLYATWPVTLTLKNGAVISGNTAAGGGAAGIEATSGKTVTCPTGTTAKVCGNPDNATATGATNCNGAGTFSTASGSDCSAVCAGGPKNANPTPTGACPSA